MTGFNTVAAFTFLDPHNKGYLDFGLIKDFICKYESEIMKESVLSIIRRLSVQPDGKITFREFSLGITPNTGCLDQAAANIEFHSEMKLQLSEAKKSYNQPLPTAQAPTTQSLRAFRPINKLDEDSPVRKEFKAIPEWQKKDPDYKKSNFHDSPRLSVTNRAISYLYKDNPKDSLQRSFEVSQRDQNESANQRSIYSKSSRV